MKSPEKDPDSNYLKKDPELTRRQLFLGAVGVYAGIVANTISENAYNDFETGRERNEIRSINDPEAAKVFPETSWMFVPGFNVTGDQAFNSLSSLQPSLRNRGQMASVGYASTGLDVDAVFSTVSEYAHEHKLKTINLYGHSFGGIIAIQLATLLRKEGIHVAMVIADSSPTASEDVRDTFTMNLLALCKENNIDYGWLFRGYGEFDERFNHKNERSWLQVIEQSWDGTFNTCSNELIQSQAYYIHKNDVSNFRSYLGDTAVVRLGNPNDTVINNQKAIQDWGKKLPHNFSPQTYELEGNGTDRHANPQYWPDIYNPVLTKIMDAHMPLRQQADRNIPF